MLLQPQVRPSFPGGLRAATYGSGKSCPRAEGAKNHRVNPGCLWTLHIGTLNVRTLRTDARLQELLIELDNVNWDVIGLCETRRKGEELVELETTGNLLYTCGTESGRCGGVGFLINQKLKDSVIKFESISDRVAQCIIQLNKKFKLQIIQAYAPTISHTDDEIEEFYDDVARLQDKEKCRYKILMGDFNARIGKKRIGENATGQYGSGERDNRGDRLVDFAEGQEFYIMNSFYKKKISRKWTWKSPSGYTSEIDYIMSNDRAIFRNCAVLNSFNVGSDHRMVRATVKINCRKEREKMVKFRKKKVNSDGLLERSGDFEIALSNRFAVLQDLERMDMATQNEEIVCNIVESAISIAPPEKHFKQSKISGETIALMKKRRTMKNTGIFTNRLEYVELCKTIRKRIQEETRQFNMKLVQKTLEDNKGINKAKRKLRDRRKQVFALKREDGTICRTRQEILELVEKFYSSLYEDQGQLKIKVVTKEQMPDILVEEVESAIKSMKNGKAPGEDNISVEMLKAGGHTLHKILAKLYTTCLKEQKIPDSWKNAEVILLHKKGAQDDLKNYRPISLLSVLYKVFTKIITKRISKTLSDAQPKEQAGFRSGFSTLDHIQVVQQIIERHNEYNMPLCMAFIDYEKAFDSVFKRAVINALLSQGVDTAYINLLQSMYEKTTATICINELKVKINVERGVRQGDTISPILFAACLEEVFRKLDWEENGIKINGAFLNHLRFADDIVLFSQDSEELQKHIQELQQAGEPFGLKINLKKSQVMFNKFIKERNIFILGEELDKVDQYIYLGQRVSMEGDTVREIERRVKCGWQAFGRLSMVFKSNLPLCLKRKVFDQCVMPVLTYGGETWTLTTYAIRKLRTAQRGMERCMLGITRRDRKTCTWIRAQTKVYDIIRRAKELKWRWAGHIARRTDDRWTKIITEWIPLGNRRPRKRPRARWADDIIKYCGPNWQVKARDRIGWRDAEEAFILQWIENG